MGSFLEDLARREAAARRRVELTREEIAELKRRLESEDEQLSRVVIAREMLEIVVTSHVDLTSTSARRVEAR